MLGPVFELEMATESRRVRTYARRVLFGLGVLALVAAADRVTLRGAGEVPHAAVVRFARGLFQALVFVQGVAVIALTPALAAGAIAGEVQRKTLQDILTTDLTAAEVVVGKAAARLCQVAGLLLVACPVLFLSAEFGGFGLAGACAALGATFSTSFFLAALAVLASTQTRSVRGALNFTMTVSLSWLILPGAFDAVLPRMGALGTDFHRWASPVNAWVAPTSPFALWLLLMRGAVRTAPDLYARVGWMVGLQLAAGTLFSALASALLRPCYRWREGGLRRRDRRRARAVSASQARAEASRRPGCGDDPMLWKEVTLARGPAAYRSLGVVAGLALTALLGWATFDYAWPAFRELWATGYGVAPSASPRTQFHFYLRIVGVGIYLVYVLGVASDAASALTSEHEKDTWVSLVTTPLTGREILRAKVLGAIWGIRHTAFTLAVLLTLGVLAGSVHPLGLLAVAVILLATAGFAAALGVWVSLRSKQSLAAVAKVVAVGLACNVGYLLLVVPVAPRSPLTYFGCTPLVVAASIVSYGDVRGRVSLGGVNDASDALFDSLWVGHGPETLAMLLASSLAYGLAGWWLYRDACRGFDARLDRPVLIKDPEQSERAGTPGRPPFLGNALGRKTRRSAVDSGAR